MKKTPPDSSTKILAVVILVACLGGGSIIALFGGGDKDEPAAPQPVVATAAASPTPTPSPSPSPVAMPDVTGQNAAVAQDTLTRAGFTNVQLGSVDPDESVVLLATNWRVAEQSTPAGTTIPSDTLIVLGCTKKR